MHQYRKLFGLSYHELLDEPVEVIGQALVFEKLLQEKQEHDLNSK